MNSLDGDLPIVIATKAEIGEASPIAAARIDGYQEVRPFRGEVGPAELTAEARNLGYDEEDLLPDAKPALVLWPPQ